jgi:hypothetical protein
MPARTPQTADTSELDSIAADHPRHHIWRETTHDGVRYIASGRDLSVHPYTLVAKSLPELRAALTTSG